MAQRIGCSARELAEKLIKAHPPLPEIERFEVAGPGFINIYLEADVRTDIIVDILEQKGNYACQKAGSQGRALVGFVSANPTGPLHIGHGRGAAYGATLVNLLTAVGYKTDSEYYVNDKGRQMDTLVLSVWFRYLDLCGESIELPEGCYQGDYVWDLAANVRNAHKNLFVRPAANLFKEAPVNPDSRLDYAIERVKALLQEQFKVLFNNVLDAMLQSIKDELERLGISYTKWFSEREFITEDEISKAIQLLVDKDMVYEKDGAKWFKSSDFGDEKDRVVIRANGQTTYFASDIAYHINKYQRGYDLLVNVWGADHHGYITRVLAAMKASGLDVKRLHIVLVQFVNLYRGGEKVSMSTRSGEFQPLSALRKEVGRDHARLFYLMRRYSQHLDFNITLAQSQNSENPVYYIQYAYARVCSLFSQLQREGYQFTLKHDSLSQLKGQEEIELLKQLVQYKVVLQNAATEKEPYILSSYLRQLAGAFHSYYNSHKFLVDDEALRNARLSLAQAIGQIIKNSLKILGISAPESM